MTPIATTLTLILALAVPGIAAWAGDDDELEFSARLRGANEVPPVETDTRGRASFEVNEAETRVEFRLRVRTDRDQDVGLLGFAGAHIHCAPEGENGPIVAFLAGEFPGGVDGVFRTRAELTAANIIDPDTGCGTTIAELVDAMIAGDTYVNVHSLVNLGGEIRGQIYQDDDD